MKKISFALLISIVCLGACKKDNNTVVNIPMTKPRVYLEGVQDITLLRSASFGDNTYTMTVIAGCSDTTPNKITVSLVGNDTAGLTVHSASYSNTKGPWSGYQGFPVSIVATATSSTTTRGTYNYTLKVSNSRATTSYPFTVTVF